VVLEAAAVLALAAFNGLVAWRAWQYYRENRRR
jgi:hypothetical protein